MTILLPISTSSKHQLSDAFLSMTLCQSTVFKGLQDAPSITTKIYEKDPQTFAEVIRLVVKLNAAHQTNSHTDTLPSQYDVW